MKQINTLLHKKVKFKIFNFYSECTEKIAVKVEVEKKKDEAEEEKDEEE